MPYIREDDPVDVRSSLLIGLALLCAIALLCLSGCKTCEPQIIYEPQPYPVVTYKTPPPLDLPEPPVMEKCGELQMPDKMLCVGTNIAALVRYSDELRITIESHNAALPEEDP